MVDKIESDSSFRTSLPSFKNETPYSNSNSMLMWDNVNFHENFSNLKIKKLKKERLLSLPPASILSSGHRSIITTRFSQVKNFHRMCLSSRQIKQLVLLSIIELRIPRFDPRRSLPTLDYRPIIGGIRRNREMAFPLALPDSPIREVNWIFISWNVSSFRRACATNIWNATRLCTILLRLTKRKRGNNPISIHRDLRFLFLFLLLPPSPLFFTSTKISSG